MSAPIIKAANIGKSFTVPAIRRDTVREHILKNPFARKYRKMEVLRDISFEVQPGESFGIMGPNGCGKSTLLRILCGIYAHDRGSVTVHGSITPVLELGIGWNPNLNAIDNILLMTTVMGQSLKNAKASVDDILAFAELEEFAEMELKFFSSGMMARLAYAAAFSSVNEILLLDEIFAVGDAGFEDKCRKKYFELKKEGRTTVLVSHRPSEISEMCSRAILIESGCVAFEGDATEAGEKYLEHFMPHHPPK